jgi:hypothetical protein
MVSPSLVLKLCSKSNHILTASAKAASAPDESPPLADLPQSPLGITSSSGNHTTQPIAPHMLATHKTVAAVAYAIPLSVVAVILLVATGLAFRHQRTLRRDRRSNADKLYFWRQSSCRSSKSAGDVELALNALSKYDTGSDVSAPVPLFMPVEAHREPKRSTRKALPPSSYTTPSARSSMKNSRPPSTRSILSANYYLPPIATTSTGFFDERDAVTQSVISDYFKPSPPVTPSVLPSKPQRLHVRDGAPEQGHDNDEPLP